MKALIVRMNNLLARIGHLSLVLLLLCGTLYVTGCPKKCVPTYQGTPTQDQRDKSDEDRQNADEDYWINQA